MCTSGRHVRSVQQEEAGDSIKPEEGAPVAGVDN